MSIKFIAIAVKQALKSNVNHKIGCVIYKGNKIVSTGFSKRSYSCSLNDKFRKNEQSIHAEQMALIKAGSNAKNCEMIVIRISKSGILRLAKPCELCHSMIELFGIKRVHYSDMDEIKTIKIKEEENG